MKQQGEAVYERGVLRPLEPLPLAEAQCVSLTISEPATGASHWDSDVVERARAEVASLGQDSHDRDKLAAVVKPIARHIEEARISVGQLVTAAGLDRRPVEAIVSGNYTPSPAQRQRLAAALGVSTNDISWGHAVPVQHMRGNGPQAGRTT